MLSKYVEPGNKIEVYDAEHRQESTTGYYSLVCEILSEDTLEIAMPMEKTKLILLSVDMRYRLIIYTKSGLYQCKARVVDRYKSNNMYIAVMELYTELRKYQRRDYYRFNCAIEVNFRALTNDEQEAIENNVPYTLEEGIPMQKGVMVDVSGGGIRFVATDQYERDSLLYLSFCLMQDGKPVRFEVVVKVLATKEVGNHKGSYEHRVKYYSIKESVREQIIKYIFQEERKNRSKNNYF